MSSANQKQGVYLYFLNNAFLRLYPCARVRVTLRSVACFCVIIALLLAWSCIIVELCVVHTNNEVCEDQKRVPWRHVPTISSFKSKTQHALQHCHQLLTTSTSNILQRTLCRFCMAPRAIIFQANIFFAVFAVPFGRKALRAGKFSKNVCLQCLRCPSGG